MNLSKIASDLDISVSTVSRALSGCGRVSEATRNAIYGYLENRELTPNMRKKRYADVKTNIIAVTMPSEEEFFSMDYFQKILSSVYDYFSIRGYQIIIIKTGYNDTVSLEQAINAHAMDGVIVSRQIERQDEIELLRNNGVPFVLVGKTDISDILQIEHDIENSCYDLANALINTGCSKLAILGAKKRDPVNQKRLKGIRKACLQNYIELSQEFIFWETETEAITEMAIEKILVSDIDCVICMDDNICLNVMFILQRMGKRVPEDIKIASLHNNAVLSKWNPPITCIRYDVGLLGREAGKLLYTYLSEMKSIPSVKLGYDIELKGSTKSEGVEYL